jgi:hypothetical protein
MKSQMASPTYTPVFAALVAVVNTKFPEIGELLLHRLVLQARALFRVRVRVRGKSLRAPVPPAPRRCAGHALAWARRLPAGRGPVTSCPARR